MTQTITIREGRANVFVAVEHANSEIVGIHASRSANRFEALEPVRQGVHRCFGAIAPGVARGLKLRHDHGSNYMSGDFQDEIECLGIEASPSFVRQPEGNGVAERFIRTLKENLLWAVSYTHLSRSGLIALLHRLGLEYHKPEVISRKLDVDTQKAFIENYDKLLNSLGDNEAVLFADAVHPTHAARPVGCWAPKQDNLAIEQTSGRQRINIHGAINLETGQTRMIDVETVDAASTITLLDAIEALYPLLALIHVFLDNARYHHAKLVQEWLARPGCRIKLHFIPAYCPHLNPIERLWGIMHKNLTHNKTYATCAQFADATLGFLREKVPRRWATYRDSVTDNFRIINPKDFRVMT